MPCETASMEVPHEMGRKEFLDGERFPVDIEFDGKFLPVPLLAVRHPNDDFLRIPFPAPTTRTLRTLNTGFRLWPTTAVTQSRFFRLLSR